MKYLMLIGDAFEDVEALATQDVLIRGGEEVILASMMGRKEITTKCGNNLVLSQTIDEVDLSSFDALIIPGGPGSFKILAFIKKVDEIISYFADKGKLVSAICAAPMLIGRLGYLKGKNYTCYPGFEEYVVDGNYKRDEGVVCDNNFITAKSMYYSIDFGLRIYEFFHGKKASESLRNACKGE